MSEDAKPSSYLIDEDGKVGAYAPEEALGLLGAGYRPAGPQQIEDFQKEEAFHQKYGTLGQQAKTFGEGAAQSLTLGLSTPVERAFGVKAEDIKGRQKENPGLHLAGSITGVAVPLIASAGAAALPEGLAGAAEATAPALISRAGEAAAEGVSGLLGEGATSVAGRLAAKAASAGASGFTEGAAYGVGQVVHEAALGDPNLTASHALEEVGLSGLLGGGIGAGTSVLGGLIGEAAGSKLGAKLSDWADNFEGNQNIKTAAGPGKGQAALKGLFKKMSPEEASKLGREAGEMGLIAPLDQPASVYEKAGEAMESAGQKMGDILTSADAAGGDVQPSAARVLSRLRNEVLAPLSENPLEASTAGRISEIADAYGEKLGEANPENKLSLSELHDLRKQVSEKIYGLRGVADPDANALKSSLHDFRGILSDEINSGIERAKLPEATVGAWKAANRQYQVAATMSGIAEKGMAGAGLSGVPLTAVMSGLTGLVHGGPLGAAVMGGGAMLAKRFGPQVLAAGARAARELVEEGAAESLASKTAEALSEAREAASATRAQALWNKLGETVGEPVGAPAKDLLRDTAGEQLRAEKEGPAGTPVETVAALSHLEAANQAAQKRVAGLAKALVKGTKVGQGVAAAAGAEEMAKHLDRVHALATNPEAMLQHVTAANHDLQEHAPNTAQAIATTQSRAVNYLHQKFPAPARVSPLSPAPRPTRADIWRYNRAREVIEKPSALLKHAMRGTLTPVQMEAVAAVHPEALRQMQQAVLEEMAGAKKVPHAARLMASVLLGQPMDAGMQPQAILATQAVFNRPSLKSPENQTGPAATGKATQKGLSKLNVAGHAMLPGQAVESRRGEA